MNGSSRREFHVLYTVASIIIGWLLAARFATFHHESVGRQLVEIAIAAGAVYLTLWAVVALIANVLDR